MTPLNRRGRAGFTLVELLVVMSIIAALAALALMLLPSIANQDMTLKATAEVQGAFKISQGLSASAGAPRGVRLLVPPGATTCTELQYLESPPVMVPDPQVLVAKATDPTGVNGPRIDFLYEVYNGTETSIDPQQPGTPPAGAIKRRHCYIIGLTPDQESQVAEGAVLVLPALGAWSRIINSGGVPYTVVNTSPRTLEVVLDVYPDSLLGAGTAYRTYYFGLYGPPVPLIGEPTVQLPKNIGIDLLISYPPGRPSMNYDIMFSPSGQTITTYQTSTNTGVTANTNIFLWVRDLSKTDMVPNTMPPSPSGWTFDPAKFRLGGEQQIVGIRNGFVGTAPVLWPDNTGSYGTSDPFAPYTLARNQLN